MQTLFADEIATAGIAAGLTALVAAAIRFFEMRGNESRKNATLCHDHNTEDRKTAVDHLTAIIKRLDEKDQDQERKLEQLHKDHLDCEKRAAAIEYQHRVLTESHTELAKKVRAIEQRSGEMGPPISGTGK